MLFVVLLYPKDLFYQIVVEHSNSVMKKKIQREWYVVRRIKGMYR